MTCDCEKRKENDDTCPPGQAMVDGKCTKIEKKSEQLGDPKTQSTQGDLPAEDSGDIQTADQHECGPGETWDSTQQMCVSTAKKDPGDGQTQGTDKTASIESNLGKLTKIVAKMAENNNIVVPQPQGSKVPTASASDSGASDVPLSMSEISANAIESLNKYGKYQFDIPLDYFRSVNVGRADPSLGVSEVYRSTPLSILEAYKKPNKIIREAVTLTGTHATQDLDTDVAIVPGGITFVPVFQFAKVKEPAQGMDRARFFKSTIPGTLAQTVGTTATEGTQTITSIEVVPSAINGAYLIGDYDEIENSPFDLIQAIVEGAAASYDNFVAVDMLTTVSDETALPSGTIGKWVRGDTGAATTTSDLAIDLTEQGVAAGREYLESQGYLRGGIKPVLALHPKQWEQLITSTNVTSLATHSTPDIWLKAQLEEFMGVQLVNTTGVEAKTNTTNDAYNALMFVPKHSYGIAVKRNVTVKFHDIGEDNQVRINTSWRTKTGVIDQASIVRISSQQA